MKATKTGLTRRANYFAAKGRNALANFIASGSIHGFRSEHCADFNEYTQ